MIRPIYVYGEPVLREKTQPVTHNTKAFQQLIDDMIETMVKATGIGLAAPQLGRKERLFVVDLRPVIDLAENMGETPTAQPKIFINPEIYWESDETIDFEEGCLSIPSVREIVSRPASVRIGYLDREFIPREIEASHLLARVAQHEYDHLKGILFIDRISPLRRQLLRRRLHDISRGRIEADYPLFITRPQKRLHHT